MNLFERSKHFLLLQCTNMKLFHENFAKYIALIRRNKTFIPWLISCFIVNVMWGIIIGKVKKICTLQKVSHDWFLRYPGKCQLLLAYCLNYCFARICYNSYFSNLSQRTKWYKSHWNKMPHDFENCCKIDLREMNFTQQYNA